MNKKLLVLIGLACIACIGIGFGYTRIIGRFDDRNIYLNLGYHPEWEMPPLSNIESGRIASILNQKYYYLSKGCQVYAFVSEDGRYVLKFFKGQHLQKKWVEYLPPMPYLSDYQKFVKNKREEKAALLFNGYKIACEELPEDTGILYIHLNKTKTLKQFISIYNKLGIKYRVNLDHVEFVLQEKAMPFYSTIEKYMTTGKLEKAKNLIQCLISVIQNRNAKGVRDKDLLLVDNVGVLGDKVIIIDPGQFVHDPFVKDPHENRKDIEMRFENFKSWLHNYYPELEKFLREKLKT